MATAPCDFSERLLWTLQLSWNWALTVNLSAKSLVCFSAFALSLWAGCSNNNNNSLVNSLDLLIHLLKLSYCLFLGLLVWSSLWHVLPSSLFCFLVIFCSFFFTGKVLLNTVKSLQMTFCMYSSSTVVTDHVVNWSLCFSCLPFKGICWVPHITEW